MAGRIEVAQGYVTIIPSLKGARQKIEAELNPAAKAAGKQAGAAIEDGIASGAAKGAKHGGAKVEAELAKAGGRGAKQAGEKMAEGMGAPVSRSSAQVAKEVQSKLGAAADGVTKRFQSIGTAIGKDAAWIGGVYKGVFSEVGEKLSNSGIAKAYAGLGTGAKQAAANIAGTFKGVASFVGSAFAPVASKVGSVFSSIGSVAGSVFKGIGSVVGTVASGIAETLGGALSSVGTFIAGLAPMAATAGAAAAAALGAVGVAAIGAYGDYEQLEGGIRLALGDDVWATVEERSKQAFDGMQISQNDYLTKVNSMAMSLRESLGGDRQAAADLADRVIRTQADVVSAMGITQEAADNAFSGIMKGNFTMLDNLGLPIKATKEGMQEVIDKMNEWNATQEDRTATQYTIDNLADCQSALADYVEYLGLSGYAANEGSKTIQGSISKMKSAWTDWLAELGKTDKEGNSIAEMGRVSENLSKSIQDVATNVVPVAANAIGAALREIPSLVSTVGPQLGQALVSIVDEATGGLATSALDFVSPITDALGGALSGIGGWVSANAGPLQDLATAAQDAGGKLVEGLGGAISAIAPVLGDLASGALPILTGAFDVLGGAVEVVAGFVQGAASFFGSLGDALAPLTEAIGPVADGIRDSLVGALGELADGLANADFSGFAEAVSGALQGVVDWCTQAVDAVKGFITDVQTFMQDPFGNLQSAMVDFVGGTMDMSSGAQGSFVDMRNGINTSTQQIVSDIATVNATPLDEKTVNVDVLGTAADNTAKTAVDNTNKAVSSMVSKSVNADVYGNAANGSAATQIWDATNAISNLQNKTVNVTVNYSATGSTQAPKAAGAVIQKHADGFIATRPLLTNVGYIGEAGAEAVYSSGGNTGIFPLTNRRFTGPFASEIASQVMDGMKSQGVVVNLNYRAGDDANQMARDLARAIDRVQRTRR